MNTHDITIQVPMSASLAFATADPEGRKAILDANKLIVWGPRERPFQTDWVNDMNDLALIETMAKSVPTQEYLVRQTNTQVCREALLILRQKGAL